MRALFIQSFHGGSWQLKFLSLAQKLKSEKEEPLRTLSFSENEYLTVLSDWPNSGGSGCDVHEGRRLRGNVVRMLSESSPSGEHWIHRK